MILRLVIETEPPPEGQKDLAKKEFDGRGEVAKVLHILVYSLTQDLQRGPLTWCGRKIVSVSVTQKEEPNGIHSAAPAAGDVVDGDKSRKG
jgi:hypothetical protein